MTLLIIGIICFFIGAIGLFALYAVNTESIKSSLNLNFLNFFVKNGTKNIFTTQLLCGLIIIIINGSALNNQIEKLYPRTQNDELKSNQQQESKVNDSESGNQSLLKSNENQTLNNQEQESYWTCNVCGRKIIGNGYCHSDDDSWKPCEEPNQGLICSPECGRKANAQFEKAANDLINNSNQNQSESYFERKREQMRRQGYTEGEINQMRDPREGDPELMESSRKVFDAIKNEVRQERKKNN